MRRASLLVWLVVLGGVIATSAGLTQGAAKTGAPAGGAKANPPAAHAQPVVAPTPERSFLGQVGDTLFGAGRPADGKWFWLQRLRVGVAIILLAGLAYYLVAAALRRAERRMKQAAATLSRVRARQQQQFATLLGLVRSVVWYAVAITTAILLLENVVGLNVMPLLTGAGIVGIAIAFGSQALVKDMVTGFFQLLEGQYAVGDFVQIGAVCGKVEDVGLRVTRLRDLQNRVYFIPNGSIVSVTTYDTPVDAYVLQAPLADPARADDASGALALLARDLRSEYPELVVSCEEPVATSGASGAHLVRLRFGLVPAQAWLANEELPERVKQLFAAREIALPEGRSPRSYADLSPLARMPSGG